MSKIHSRETAWILLAIAVAAIELFFGFRAAVMYGAFLKHYIDTWELWAFQGAVMLGVTIGGYVLSTHRQYGVEAIAERLMERAKHTADYNRKLSAAETGVFLACAVIVLHEIAGVIYTVFGNSSAVTFIAIIVTIGMSAFVLLPFFLGHMMLAIAESLSKERQQTFETTVDGLDQKMKLAAAKAIVDEASDLPATERIKGLRHLLPREEEPRKRIEQHPLEENRLNRNGRS